ncbi:hypothetical protein [Holzapfeliella sp. JNUCC 72]
MKKKLKVLAAVSASLQVLVLIFSISMTVLMGLSDQNKFTMFSYETLKQWSDISLPIQISLMAITLAICTSLSQKGKKESNFS